MLSTSSLTAMLFEAVKERLRKEEQILHPSTLPYSAAAAKSVEAFVHLAAQLAPPYLIATTGSIFDVARTRL